MENLKVWESICSIPDSVLREVMLSWYRALCKSGLFSRKKISPSLFISIEKCLSESPQTKRRLLYLQTWIHFNTNTKKRNYYYYTQIDSTIELVLNGRLSYFNFDNLRYIAKLSNYHDLIQDLIEFDKKPISGHIFRTYPMPELGRKIVSNQKLFGVQSLEVPHEYIEGM